MEISRQKLAIIMLFTILASVSVSAVSTYAMLNLPRLFHRDPQARMNVYIFKETPSGIEQLAVGNDISDIGERYIRNILGFNNVTAHNATKWISLGNCTADHAHTKLTTEATTTGFTRAEGTVVAWVNSGDYAYNVTKKFTATGNIAVNYAGLHWSDTSNSDNNMFAEATLGATEAFQNNWNCTIKWVITWNAND